MRRFAPESAEALPTRLAHYLIDRHPRTHALRVALDAPVCVDTGPLALGVGAALAALGHEAAVIDTATFYRDASLRYEYGKRDVESYYSGWLDASALGREVVAPLGTDGNGGYLPSLRDPITNRATREPARRLPPSGVAILRGSLLLAVDLNVDLAVHLNVSRQARRRLTTADWAWTLPAYDRYDIDVDPTARAQVVIRYDDPAHPAVSADGW